MVLVPIIQGQTQEQIQGFILLLEVRVHGEAIRLVELPALNVIIVPIAGLMFPQEVVAEPIVHQVEVRILLQVLVVEALVHHVLPLVQVEVLQ